MAQLSRIVQNRCALGPRTCALGVYSAPRILRGKVGYILPASVEESLLSASSNHYEPAVPTSRSLTTHADVRLYLAITTRSLRL